MLPILARLPTSLATICSLLDDGANILAEYYEPPRERTGEAMALLTQETATTGRYWGTVSPSNTSYDMDHKGRGPVHLSGAIALANNVAGADLTWKGRDKKGNTAALLTFLVEQVAIKN